MARTIWKYPLDLADDIQEIEMPAGARVVSVAMQGDSPTIWALVHPEQPLEKRHFSIHGTGHAIPNGEGYLGACLAPPFVWHVFEVWR